MRKKLLVAASAVFLAAAPMTAHAAGTHGTGTVVGAGAGAITGAILAGPIGAVVGVFVGGALGTALAPPQVVAYATANPAPAAYAGELHVGAVLPASVPVQPVPPHVYVEGDPTLYAYATINGVPVIVDAHSRVVIQIVG